MSKKCKSDNGVSHKNCGSASYQLYLRGIQHFEFTPLSKVKGSVTDKLAQLQSIHDIPLVELVIGQVTWRMSVIESGESCWCIFGNIIILAATQTLLKTRVA